MLALGIGTIVSTAIFTLPGIIAANHAGPAVAISFVIAAIVSGLAALLMRVASALPFAGSAYSWANVVFGEVFGWIAGWALWRNISSLSLSWLQGGQQTSNYSLAP